MSGIKKLRTGLSVLCLTLTLMTYSQPAEAWFDWDAWGFSWGEEPGDNCQGFHWMCHDYCGGGSSMSDCTYIVPPADYTNGFCFCA